MLLEAMSLESRQSTIYIKNSRQSTCCMSVPATYQCTDHRQLTLGMGLVPSLELAVFVPSLESRAWRPFPTSSSRITWESLRDNVHRDVRCPWTNKDRDRRLWKRLGERYRQHMELYGMPSAHSLRAQKSSHRQNRMYRRQEKLM